MMTPVIMLNGDNGMRVMVDLIDDKASSGHDGIKGYASEALTWHLVAAHITNVPSSIRPAQLSYHYV